MTDTIDTNNSHCCMRKNSDYKNEIYEAAQVNVGLTAIYLVAFVSGFKVICLGSFISIIINSVYMWEIFSYRTPDVEEDNSLNDSQDSEESEESQEDNVNDTLSLKQREHGATLAKAMNEEDEIILNSRFKKLVEDNRRRNEALVRTPTNTSLDEMADDDEHMPDLIRPDPPDHCSTCKRPYTYISQFTFTDDMYSALEPTPTPYISTVKEILWASKSANLHDMYNVD